MNRRLLLGTLLVLAALSPAIFVVVASAIGAVSGASPENVTVTAGMALGAAADAAKALSARNFSAAIGPILLLLGFALKHPATGSLFSKIPPRWRAVAMLVGGGAATSGSMIAAGVPLFEALVSGFQAGTSATGCYEIWQGITTTPLRDKLKEALAIPDPKIREDAVSRLANE
jgi:hypothetical protein